MSSGDLFDVEIVVVPTAGIVAHPSTLCEDVSILLTRIKEFLNSLIIAWRALFPSLTIILWTVVVILACDTSWFAHLRPALLGPAAGHVTTIYEGGYFLLCIVVRLENPAQPRRITIPVMIHRKNRFVIKLDSDSCSGSHGVLCDVGVERSVVPPPPPSTYQL
tara:strand:- start:1325 stop:1813 length:489 start_codon:yes stop_codon:yes gene_type:complete